MRNGVSDKRGGFSIRRLYEEKKTGEKIENLIVTTKGFQTAEAMRPLSEALSKDSNVLLCQNGMGTYRVVLRADYRADEKQQERSTA